MASPILKRHLFSRPRGSPETSKIRELDRGQIGVEGIVTLEWAFSATLDAVQRPLFRAHYSLSETEGCLLILSCATGRKYLGFILSSFLKPTFFPLKECKIVNSWSETLELLLQFQKWR